MKTWILSTLVALLSCTAAPLSGGESSVPAGPAGQELFYPDYSSQMSQNRHGDDIGWYKQSTVTAVIGHIVSIIKWNPRSSQDEVYTFFIELQDGTVMQVYLGPTWYVDKQGVSFQEGDKAYVIGSEITYHKQTFIIAAEVDVKELKNPATKIPLRSYSGAPFYRSGEVHPKGQHN